MVLYSVTQRRGGEQEEQVEVCACLAAKTRLPLHSKSQVRILCQRLPLQMNHHLGYAKHIRDIRLNHPIAIEQLQHRCHGCRRVAPQARLVVLVEREPVLLRQQLERLSSEPSLLGASQAPPGLNPLADQVTGPLVGSLVQQQVGKWVETRHDPLHKVPVRKAVNAGLRHLGSCDVDDVGDGPRLLLKLVELEDDGVEFCQRRVTLVVGALEYLVVRDNEHLLALQLTLSAHVLGTGGQLVCLPPVGRLLLVLSRSVGHLVFHLSFGVDG